MNEMCLASRVPHRFRYIVFAGLLICLTMFTGVGLVLADDKAPATTQPATSLDAQKLFAQASPAVVKIHTYDADGRPLGQGSGFLIDAAGTIVTNHHVIKDAASARVYIQNQPSLPVTRIVAVDKQADLAIIKVDGKDLPFLKLRVALPKVGEKVFAIGSPKGYTNTLSDGLVSGLRPRGGTTVIQTSAPITYGSSGGPLLSSDGAVVGVTTRIRSGEGDLGFAVPAERVANLIKNPTLPARGASGLGKPPEAKAAGAPKVYNSLRSLLSRIPKKLIPKSGQGFTFLQFSLIREWFATNAPSGTVQCLTGRFSSSSPDRVHNRIGINFKSGYISIHHNNEVRLYACAYVPRHLAADVLRLKRGETVTLHGKIDKLTIYSTGARYRGSSDPLGGVRLVLTDCAFGRIPPSRNPREKPKPTSRPALPKRTDEDKARSQLALAKNYIGAGLKTKALDVLKELIAKYPKTRAATDAQAELEKLGKQ